MTADLRDRADTNAASDDPPPNQFRQHDASFTG